MCHFPSIYSQENETSASLEACCTGCQEVLIHHCVLICAAVLVNRIKLAHMKYMLQLYFGLVTWSA